MLCDAMTGDPVATAATACCVGGGEGGDLRGLPREPLMRFGLATAGVGLLVLIILAADPLPLPSAVAIFLALPFHFWTTQNTY